MMIMKTFNMKKNFSKKISSNLLLVTTMEIMNKSNNSRNNYKLKMQQIRKKISLKKINNNIRISNINIRKKLKMIKISNKKMLLNNKKKFKLCNINKKKNNNKNSNSNNKI